MIDKNNFKDLLDQHLDLVHKDLNFVSHDFSKRSSEHDLDKIFNKKLYSIYDEHFPKLKKFDYGTTEYMSYEREHMLEAHKIHGKQRHHFYSKHNEIKDVNLIDLIEAVVDISCSAKQYNNDCDINNQTCDIDIIMKSIASKGILEMDLEKLIKNTLTYIEENK